MAARAQAAGTLASMGEDEEHQREIVSVGGIPPLVALIKGGSASAQSFAAQALANAAACSRATQNLIAAAGAVPLLMSLLSVGDPHEDEVPFLLISSQPFEWIRGALMNNDT